MASVGTMVSNFNNLKHFKTSAFQNLEKKGKFSFLWVEPQSFEIFANQDANLSSVMG
jgi:hypothetical protein